VEVLMLKRVIAFIFLFIYTTVYAATIYPGGAVALRDTSEHGFYIIDTIPVPDDTIGFMSYDGIWHKYGNFDSLDVDVFDTLGAYLDTNTNIRDSVHAYQEATDSLATPKIKANFFAPEDSTHMTFLDDIIQLDSDAESLFVSDESGIRLWHDDSVGNSDYGRFLYIYRHAPEGDAYARFGIDAYKYASFYASNGWVFSGGTTLFNCTLLSDKAIRFHANAAGSNIKFNTALGTILDIETLDFSIIHTDASGDTVMVGDTTQYDFNVPIITPYAEIEDSITVGEGGTITKIIKVGSHLAIILGIDTLWAAKDTTGF